MGRSEATSGTSKIGVRGDSAPASSSGSAFAAAVKNSPAKASVASARSQRAMRDRGGAPPLYSANTRTPLTAAAAATRQASR